MKRQSHASTQYSLIFGSRWKWTKLACHPRRKHFPEGGVTPEKCAATVRLQSWQSEGIELLVGISTLVEKRRMLNLSKALQTEEIGLESSSRQLKGGGGGWVVN